MIQSIEFFFKSLHNAGKFYAVLTAKSFKNMFLAWQFLLLVLAFKTGSCFFRTMAHHISLFWTNSFLLDLMLWDALCSNNLSFNSHIKHSTSVLIFGIVLKYFFLKLCYKDWPCTLLPWVNGLSLKFMPSLFSSHTFPCFYFVPQGC